MQAQAGACRFFINWLVLALLHNMAITQFRTVGALTRNIVVANACGSLTLLLTLMMGGFVIPKTNVSPMTGVEQACQVQRDVDMHGRLHDREGAMSGVLRLRPGSPRMMCDSVRPSRPCLLTPECGVQVHPWVVWIYWIGACTAQIT